MRSRPTVTEKDASQYTGWSVAFLRKCRRKNRGPAYLKVGRSIRYRIEDLDAWLDAHRVEPKELQEPQESLAS